MSDTHFDALIVGAGLSGIGTACQITGEFPAEGRRPVTALYEATGEQRTHTCGFLINCTGYYNYNPGLPPRVLGVDRFGGQCVHPQHWPEDLD
ncbi:hypothetical protein OHS70_34790 [Streptomyces sp. NBC_00390]|uniref:hypothetical protein n=1 Tax=Streptomyces sp. NBC_00390 TaxID=2975736 RepID=UPI002E223312